MKDVYLYLDKKTVGPFTQDQLTTMWKAGQINKTTFFAYQGEGWQPLENICSKIKPLGLFRLIFNIVAIVVFLAVIGFFVVSFLAAAVSR